MHNSNGKCAAGSSLMRHDLCAQLAPLNQYGLNEFSSAIVHGLIALAGASKKALSHSRMDGDFQAPSSTTAG